MLDFKKFDFFFLPNNVFLAPLFDGGRLLESMTGFTGSFGMAFFSSENSGVFFTDGRYTTQAKQELQDNFEIKLISELKTWLQTSKEKNFVFDPRLYTKSWHNLFVENIFSPLDVKKLDAIYENHKIAKPNILKVYQYPEQYAGLSHKQKIAQFLENLQGDAFFIIDPENVSWLLNIRSDNLDFNQNVSCCAIVSKDSVDIFLQDVLDFELAGVNVHKIENLEDILKYRDFKKIAIDKNKSNFYIGKLLSDLEIETAYIDDPIYEMRAIKNDIEIENFRKIHTLDGFAKTKFLLWLIKNFQDKNFEITEFDAADKLLEFRRENEKFVRPSFDTIAGSGANSAIIHYNPSKKNCSIIKKNEIFLLDSGGHYLGGTTDCTRTMFWGEKPTDEQKKNYTLVLKGHIRLQNAVFPVETKCSALDLLARYDLLQKGLNYPHSTGHGVGNFLHVHETPPRIGQNSDDKLHPGMILSNEPGVYFEGECGIRLENLMLVIKKNEQMLAFEYLTVVPFALNLVDFSLLSEQEKNCLMSYNQDTFTKLKEFLNSEEQKLFHDYFLSVNS